MGGRGVWFFKSIPLPYLNIHVFSLPAVRLFIVQPYCRQEYQSTSVQEYKIQETWQIRRLLEIQNTQSQVTCRMSAGLLRMTGCLLPLLAILLAGAEGQEDFQGFLDQMESDYKLLGLAAGAFSVHEEGWVLRGDLGRRMSEDPTPVQGEDMWALGNAGRPLVTALAARLVQGGALRWNTTLGEVYSGPGLVTVSPGFQDVTLLDLLVHNGGAPNEEMALSSLEAIDFVDSLWERSDYSQEYSGNAGLRREMAGVILASGVEPAEAGTYSQYTYSLAVGLIETVTNSSFRSLLAQEVLVPLDMQGCGVGPPTLDSSLPPVQPWGHFAGPWGYYNIPSPGPRGAGPSATAPDQGLHCSLDSLKNFLTAHLQRPESFLSAENWQLLQTAQSKVKIGYGRYADYAPGFFVADSLRYEYGGDGTSSAQIVMDLEQGFGLVIACNTPIEGGMRQEVGWTAIRNYMWETMGPPTAGKGGRQFLPAP